MPKTTKRRARRSPLEDAAREADKRLQEVIDYLNDDVVPKVRTQSTRALRIAAGKLQELADYMDERKR